MALPPPREGYTWSYDPGSGNPIEIKGASAGKVISQPKAPLAPSPTTGTPSGGVAPGPYSPSALGGPGQSGIWQAPTGAPAVDQHWQAPAPPPSFNMSYGSGGAPSGAAASATASAPPPEKPPGAGWDVMAPGALNPNLGKDILDRGSMKALAGMGKAY